MRHKLEEKVSESDAPSSRLQATLSLTKLDKAGMDRIKLDLIAQRIPDESRDIVRDQLLLIEHYCAMHEYEDDPIKRQLLEKLVRTAALDMHVKGAVRRNGEYIAGLFLRSAKPMGDDELAELVRFADQDKVRYQVCPREPFSLAKDRKLHQVLLSPSIVFCGFSEVALFLGDDPGVREAFMQVMRNCIAIATDSGLKRDDIDELSLHTRQLLKGSLQRCFAEMKACQYKLCSKAEAALKQAIVAKSVPTPRP